MFRDAIYWVWLMFLCFKRKNYNKNPLIWLCQLLYWEKNNKELFDTIASNIAAIDEYRVENTHSIIRGNTNKYDPPDLLSRKAKAIFSSKSTLHNFKSSFTPPKNYTFSRSSLKGIKVAVAKILVSIFKSISDDSDWSEIPAVLKNENSINLKMMPIEYHTARRPKSTLS